MTDEPAPHLIPGGRPGIAPPPKAHRRQRHQHAERAPHLTEHPLARRQLKGHAAPQPAEVAAPADNKEA